MTAPAEREAGAPRQRHYGTRRPLGTIEFIRRLRDNAISIYPPEAFEMDYSARRLGWQRFVLLNEPEMIRHVLVGNYENYGKGRLARQILGPVLGQGLLTSEGELWRRQRRIAAPAFQHKRLAVLAETMAACARDWADQWAGPAKTGDALDIAKQMSALTMEIVARTLFGSDIAGRVDPMRNAVTAILRGFGRPSLPDLVGLPEWLPRRRDPEATAALRQVGEMVREIVAARQGAVGERGDLLDMLLAARDEETGAGMSARQLHDEILTLFAAGHETTATGLTWTWYLLDQHPEVRERLEAEIDAVLGGRPPDYADLERMPYGRMVFEEALRIYPPVFTLNREALGGDRIGPLEIGRGDLVSMSPYVTHRNPKLWPEPERFDPERFAPKQVAARPKFAYFPFGGGPRICIGANFALIEARLILATLMQRYRLRLVPGHPVVPHAVLTLRTRYGLKMTIEPR